MSNIPHTQQQYQVVNNGQPIVPVQIQVKQPGDNELLIEIHASSVNPLDVKLRLYYITYVINYLLHQQF